VSLSGTRGPRRDRHARRGKSIGVWRIDKGVTFHLSALVSTFNDDERRASAETSVGPSAHANLRIRARAPFPTARLSASLPDRFGAVPAASSWLVFEVFEIGPISDIKPRLALQGIIAAQASLRIKVSQCRRYRYNVCRRCQRVHNHRCAFGSSQPDSICLAWKILLVELLEPGMV
jgi:hypothetical protein